MTAPNREAVEAAIGRPLLEWQWTVLLGLLGLLPTQPVTPLPKLDIPVPLKKFSDHPDFEHTCVICGRKGTRQFANTPNGWRCTAYDPCERRASQPTPSTLAQLLDSRIGIS